MKHILKTKIKTQLPKNEVMKRAEERANHFLEVPGLIRKFWTHDEEENCFYGIFEFESRNHIEDYLDTDFADSVEETYETTEAVEIQTFKVLKEQGREE